MIRFVEQNPATTVYLLLWGLTGWVAGGGEKVWSWLL